MSCTQPETQRAGHWSSCSPIWPLEAGGQTNIRGPAAPEGGHSQHVYPGQAPEGPIRELADAVPLQLQHLQTLQPLERQALDEPNPIPVEVPEEKKMAGSEGTLHAPCRG